MISKFRVWLPNPDVERMLRVKALVFEHDKTRCVCGYAYDFYLEDEDAIIMQSTGLRDKNGKEIFEGDILAIETDEGILNVNIFWDSKHALFMFESKKYNEKDLLAELVEDNTYPFEITGNIYENPD
ncbi:YopX family protein [uncultured Streptococcus sp.]|uniref:YopX family protein n=1 Tax=uncultured Streptococcus sp. TaxID=83427 RepID=UPI00267567A6|nr:YopX family protein [uncultured Streptococcus sp.]